MGKKRIKPLEYVLLSVALILTFIIVIPAFIGVWNYVAGEENIPSSSSSVELALLSAALGAHTLWFAYKSTDEKQNNDGNIKISIEHWGKSLLFAAFCFTIFTFLAPLLSSENITGTPAWDTLLKWIAGIVFMAGSISLIITTCFGVVYIWTIKT